MFQLSAKQFPQNTIQGEIHDKARHRLYFNTGLPFPNEVFDAAFAFACAKYTPPEVFKLGQDDAFFNDAISTRQNIELQSKSKSSLERSMLMLNIFLDSNIQINTNYQLPSFYERIHGLSCLQILSTLEYNSEKNSGNSKSLNRKAHTELIQRLIDLKSNVNLRVNFNAGTEEQNIDSPVSQSMLLNEDDKETSNIQKNFTERINSPKDNQIAYVHTSYEPGDTALMLSIRAGNSELALHLIKQGADLVSLSIVVLSYTK